MKYFTYPLFLIFLLGTSYITAAKTLTIARGDGQYPPYEWLDDGIYKGIHIDLIKKAATNLNIEIKFTSLPWSRALLELKLGNIDALTFISRNDLREQYGVFFSGNILSTTRLRLFKHKQNLKYSFNGKMSSIEDATVGVQRNFFYDKEFDSSTLFSKLGFKNYSQVLDMVLLKRIDFGIINELELLYAFKNDPRLKDIEFVSPPISQTDVYLAFSRKENLIPLAKLFAEELARLTEGKFYTNLLKQYISPSK